MALEVSPGVAERIAGLPSEEQVKALDLLKRLDRAKRTNAIETYTPYPWQRDMHAAGLTKPERMARAANRSGKTFSGGCETAYHATGEYPDWWEGRRFDKERSLVIWVGSKTGASSRDIVQAELLGDVEGGDEIGTGSIPLRCIEGKPKFRQSSVSNVVDYIWIKRKNGGRCKLQFYQYEMGWQKWQGARVHFIWLDEEPSRGDFPTDEDYRIFTECQTRVADNEGLILVTFTPLSGRTPLVEHFEQNPPIPGTAIFTAGWDDAPHLSDERKAQLRASYPAHEVAARTTGVPMVGSGLIWTTPEDMVLIDDVPVPSHWRQIIGHDFGINHPAASARCAFDDVEKVFYVIAGYKKQNEISAYHAARFHEWGPWIPVSWPHDGHKKSEGSGGKLVEMRYQYHQAGANMLGKSARYPPRLNPKTGKQDDIGGAQPVEPIVNELHEDMQAGRFRVFRSVSELFFNEMRQFHRDGKGQIVARNDDFIKAVMYAKMMVRYAVPASMRRGRMHQAPTMKAMRLN